MSNLEVLCSIVGVIIVVIATIVVIIPKLREKGVDVPKYLDGTKKAVDTTEKFLNVADEVLPENPVISVLKIIEKWAKIGVGNAEELYHSNDIDKDKRKEIAQNVVYTMLNEMGIELTAPRKELIDAVIRDSVRELGHKTPDESQRQAEKDKLISENQKLLQQNENLTNVVNQIKGIVPIQ